MGITEKFKEFINPYDEVEEVEMTEDEAKAISEYEKPQNSGVARLGNNTKMVLFEPRSFDEAEEIARHLKDHRAAVINLHRLPRDFAQRTIDFLTGVVFALDGSIQKIGHNVILCAPNNIGVHGEISLDGADDSED